MSAAGSTEEQLGKALRERREGILAAYLFGSQARGDAGLGSDVDVAVLYSEAPPAVLDSPPRRLERELEKVLGRTVEVVALNTAPPDLVHRVLRDGRLLLEEDRSARIRFEVRARNEYFDLEPLRRLYRRRERAAS
jgi:predicted nucleotidyltransferase